MDTGYRNFHSGEARMQASVGINTAEYDRSVDQPFRPELNRSEVSFVGRRTFSVAASLDDSRRPWASPLIGAAGDLFLVEDPTTVTIRPRPVDGDRLLDNVRVAGEMGVLYIDPSRRRRAKSLGVGTVQADGSISYRMHRMFGLCTKYIFKRSHEVDVDAGVDIEVDGMAGGSTTVGPLLSPEHRDQLAAADTIFLASHSDQHGTDSTHRGGPPGFVTVVDNTTLAIPDYLGNGMFQTLGNLLLDDRIGLLAIDFRVGRILQLTGRGSIQAAADGDAHSQRTLLITIEEVRSTRADIGRWTDIEPYDLGPAR